MRISKLSNYKLYFYLMYVFKALLYASYVNDNGYSSTL